MVAAWAGDSRAVIGTAGAGGEYSAVDLTKDHKPNHLSEMTRIMAAGGRVARVRKDKNGNPAGAAGHCWGWGAGWGLCVVAEEELGVGQVCRGAC